MNTPIGPTAGYVVWSANARRRASGAQPKIASHGRRTALGKPVLVLFGEEDQRWRSSSAELYADVPGAEVKLPAGLGHSPMVEDPTRTAELRGVFARSVFSGGAGSA
ncbi:hypothetical protein O7627_10890 [Solwaraspora sp. WMMD1047]|uniref:alpha/beta fold hydrolase n=1 Tax=Solwaraspora sp. WMMD1047 TaxID=3016102 RepID=UPI002417428F|nr:hypothetical protein [Solwaraspora sp. WMMD1047]MDG4829805.1 hypothetical protein [Solwaraspora sp. WMMD1047]